MLGDMSSRRALLGALFTIIPFAAVAQNQLLDEGRNILNQIPGGVSQGGKGAAGAKAGGAGLREGEIGAGVRDALKVAAGRVVGRVGKTDGYNADPAFRIPLPGPVQKIDPPLKAVGASGILDNLQLKMNRAAEEAAPKALNIFVDAASRMSIDDARAILAGPKDAATQYFKRTTSGSLSESFRPIVDKSLASVGAVKAFKSVQSEANTIPFAGQEIQGFDLTDFTVGKALDGHFHFMGVEEAAIRTNPAARTTDLLKKVFV